MELLIKNAVIASSQSVEKGNLLIQDERIAAVGNVNAADDVPILDAEGLYLLPGGVDVHTHFDLDVGFDRASDDWYTGTVAAACGGTTAVVDHMAFGPKGCRLGYQAEVYHKLAKDAVIDYGFHGVIQHVDSQVLEDMASLMEMGIPSFKVYLTYNYGLSDADLLRVLQKSKELGAVICAHCENDGIIQVLREELLTAGKTAPRYHPISRPAACEAEAVWRMLMLAKTAGEANVYVVHLSTALGLEAIRTAKRQGQANIGVESCPQYLWLDEALYADDREGLKYIMSPPLRGKADRAALWEGLSQGEIDVIGTDHCPFFFETQKQRGRDNFSLAPGGAPGVETRMQLLFSAFLEGRISLTRVVESCCTKPAAIFGLASRKGDIKVGGDADLVLFDPSTSGEIRHELLHERVDYTPYEGIPVRGRPVMTFSRGRLVAENGQFVGEKGGGKFLHRQF
ncbi:MAG: dihydropyrimidinase [Oscillospiraceae bacterium]